MRYFAIALAFCGLAACDNGGLENPFSRYDGGGIDVCGSICAAGTVCNVTLEKCTVTGSVDACNNRCDGGTVCSGGYCIPTPTGTPCDGLCGAGTSCVNDVCTSTSSSCNNACGAGTTCVNGVCVSSSSCANVVCGAGTYCSNGVCVANSCANVSCSAGYTCQNGVCVANNSCVGVVCSSGYTCSNGVCVLSSGTCGTPGTNGVASQVSVTSTSSIQIIGEVKTAEGTGSFSGSQTVTLESGDYANSVLGSVVAALAHDQVTIGGIGAVEYWVTNTANLAGRHGHATSDESYMSSSSAVADALNDFLSWRALAVGSRGADLFYLKGSATLLSGQVWVDPQLASGLREIAILFAPRCGTQALNQ